MQALVNLIPIVLYFMVGLICLVMAFKCFFSKKFLPFHEQAAGKLWNEIENPLQLVILSLLRLSGLGFLVVAILLIVCPMVNYFVPNRFYTYSIPGIALLFCLGLLVNNYMLYKNTKADTPWKGSLYAMIVILSGMIISLIH